MNAGPEMPWRGSPVVSFFAVLVLLLLATAAQALIISEKGNKPIRDNNWPAGSVDVANLQTRLGWWEGPPFGGGQHNFSYRGNTAAFQAALDLFGKIKAPELRVVIHEGPQSGHFLKDNKDDKVDDRIDWSFTIWNPQSWNHLYNNPKSTFSAEDPNGGFRNSVEPPRLDVYIGGAPEGKGIDWKQVKVPPTVKVIDERASANGYKAGVGSVLRGDVFDMVTSKPVAGAKVTVQKHAGKAEQYDDVATGNADASGHFELTGVPEGGYRVVASADGYVPRMIGYASFGKDTLREYTVRLCPPGTIKGTVNDTSGKLVANAKVRADNVMAVDGKGYLLPSRAQVTTDAQGKFEIATLPRGFCQLHVSGKPYAMVEPFKTQTVPSDDVVLVLTMTGTVKGKVAKADGTPPSGPWIAIVEPEGGTKIGKYSGSGTIAPDGTFTFENVPPGKYVVKAQPNPGRTDVQRDTKTIEVKPGEAAEVMIEAK